MAQGFSGFKSIILIDDRTDTRSVSREVVASLGVKPIAMASVAEAITHLQNEPAPDWIFSTLDLKEKSNAFHLMNLILENPEFINTRISLSINPEEKDLIPLAFEMGCLSVHTRPFTKASLSNELQLMFSKLTEDYTKHGLVAANFLRDYFNEKELFKDLIDLEKSMLLRYPDEIDLYLKLCEAYILNGQIEESKKILWQAKYLSKDLQVGVKQLKDLIEAHSDDGEQIDFESTTIAQAFDIDEVVLVDTDDTSIRQLKGALSELGITNIKEFNDGQSGFEYLKGLEKKPSLLFHEWKLPKLTGPALLQRLRRLDSFTTPIIVHSSLLKPEDESLTKEMGAAAIIRKPFVNEHFLNSLMVILRNQVRADNSDAALQQMTVAFNANDSKLAERVYKDFCTLKDVPDGIKYLMEAQISYLRGDYARAKECSLLVFKSDGESILTLNVLGKVFLKIGDSESAIKCLNRAQKYSSTNLERLCLLAEAHSEVGDINSAKENLSQAKAVDEKSDLVAETAAKVAINSKDDSMAKEILGGLEALGGVLSYTNNRAVLLARQEKYDESIELYNSVIASLPEDKVRESSIVRYNLSLAYAKMNKTQEAEAALKAITNSKDFPSLHAKIQSLSTRVEDSIKTKKPLKLNVVTEEDRRKKILEDKASGYSTAIHAAPGDLCLHMIFKGNEETSSKAGELLKNRPRFNRPHQKIAS
jgi:CheY-like chemotaxis protein